MTPRTPQLPPHDSLTVIEDQERPDMLDVTERPRRIQRKRTKGWRLPAGAIIVSRPGRYGNPWMVKPARRSWLDMAARRTPYTVVNRDGASLGTFVSEERARYWAVQGFRRDFDGDVTPLRGHDLACWCPLEDEAGNPVPCHADVLLERANS